MSQRLGRNDPCHCGSGKKYKKCHMREDQARAPLPPGVSLESLEQSILPSPAQDNPSPTEAQLPDAKVRELNKATAQLEQDLEPEKLKEFQERMAALQSLMSFQGNASGDKS